ncbi:HEPN domain-containing protein [Thiohalospira sp.]|uniref:HEPN domain-containing protein n=1 Tax=Thiohalospira sp. TaxID=3080549 RepID=UPI00398151B8
MSREADWLRQAANDLAWAEHSHAGGFHAQTCFAAQQAGEKALKALCFTLGYDIVRTHSLFQIVEMLGVNGELREQARELDFYYLTGRYPDAFPAGAPFEMIRPQQAESALQAARGLLDTVTRRIGPEPGART